MTRHTLTIRDYAPGDFEAVFAINEASTPGVSQESQESLRQILSVGICRVAIGADGKVTGFINLVEPGTLAYGSDNLRWLEAWQEKTGRTQIYVDRIALAEAARGQGVGPLLYEDAYQAFSDRDVITCEVNTLPNNPGSHRFHKRCGFEPIGEQVFKPGEKAVAYYARALR